MASKTCVIHFEGTKSSEKVIPFSDKTIQRVSECRERWSLFVCTQGEVARRSLEAFSDLSVDEAGIHKKCYNRFTDSSRLERFAERSVTEQGLLFEASEPTDCTEPVCKKLRSSSSFSASTPSSALFPIKCIFCNKKRKDIVNRKTGKRSRETLQKCELVHSDELLKAAEARQDSDILRQVSGVDLVAKELRYHHTCKQSYVYILRDQKRNTEGAFDQNTVPVPVSADGSTSTTDSTDSESEIIGLHQFEVTEEANKRQLYHGSIYLREQIMSVKSPAVWPPDSKDLTTEHALEMIPVDLFNFLVWICGASSEVELDKFVDVSETIKRKILSIAQDILHLAHRGGLMLPKHYALGMTVRHWTGQSNLISLLNGFGHCMSHSSVLELDTALAEQQLSKSDIPEGFQKNTFTQLAWDNNDFGEETLTGKGTTHNTNGIIVQRQTTLISLQTEEIAIRSEKEPQKKDKKRSVTVGEETIPEYHASKRVAPRLLATPADTILAVFSKTELEKKCTNSIDLAMSVSKMSDEGESQRESVLPGWTGFNVLLKSEEPTPPTSKVGYLPVINGSPTQLNTVNAVFMKSLAIADELDIDCIVLTFDLAFYAKAQQVRWNDPMYSERTVVRLGEFHTCLSFLSVIGKRFEDCGLSDILLESGIVAPGSLPGVMKGRHYNRCMRVLKTVADALRRLLLNVFTETLNEEDQARFRTLRASLRQAFPHQLFQELSMAKDFDVFSSKLSSFIQERCLIFPTFAFWISYLDMADLLLNFIRATREGDWALHLKTAAKMVPWYFAYGHVNYARYLPVYIREMLDVPVTHPSVSEHLSAGEFVVQQQERFPFCQTAMDQTIEQTVNRDSKTKGGQAGFSNNPGAVHRWILSHNQRAEIAQHCVEMAGKMLAYEKKDLSKSRCEMEEEAVQRVMQAVETMQNPFMYYVEELINIASGQVAPPEATEDLLSAYTKGCSIAVQFVEERLVSRQVNFYDPVRKLQLKTFSSMQKMQVCRPLQNAELKMDKDLMARLLVVARNRKVDLTDLLAHSLSQFPRSLSDGNGSLQKTNKAMLLHHLESKFPEIHVGEVPQGAALILDGMAVIQQLADKVPATFGAFSSFIFKHIIKLACFYGAPRVDFVCDRYCPFSIKDDERRRRTSATGCLQRPLSENQKLPIQFRKFLTLGKNKESLAAFLMLQWGKMPAEEFCGKTVYSSCSQQCFRLSPQGDMAHVVPQPVQELANDHEEADTLVLLHAKHASASFASVIIKTPDTDIFLLCLAHQQHIRADLHVSTGTGNASRLLSVRPIAEKCGPAICSAVLSLHAFTGCDSVSCFKGKGKVKPFLLMQEEEQFIDVFRTLGTTWDLSVSSLQGLEQFVCMLYGQKAVSSVTEARVNIFKSTGKFDSTLPPSSDSLHLHARRANYQAAVWRLSLQASITAPLPTHHGWKLQDEQLVVQWTSRPPAQSLLTQLVKCSCKKNNCNSRRCSCVSQNLSCTGLCQCLNCTNHADEGESQAYDEACDSDTSEYDGDT